MRWPLACLLVAATACSPGASVARTEVPPTAAAIPTTHVSIASAAREASPSAGGLAVSAIQRLDSERGYVAAWTGSGVGLASTTDGGQTWTRIAVPAAHLSSLRFIDSVTGWVGGFALPDTPQTGCNGTPPNGDRGCRGVVLRTEDGGQSWQDVLDTPSAPGGAEPVIGLQAVDGLRAWVLVGDPTCLPRCPTDVRRTDDGGHSWVTVLHDNVAAIRFASASRGWAATSDLDGHSRVLYTTDGGTTWRVGMQLSSAWPIGLDAATTARAWLLTRDNSTCTSSNCLRFDIYRTDDGGATWSSFGNPKTSAPGCSFGDLSGPLFASAGRGWLADNTGAGGVAGPTGLLTSEDGGRTWSCLTGLSQTRLVSAADPDHVWVTAADPSSQNSLLYTSEDGGRTWRALSLP